MKSLLRTAIESNRTRTAVVAPDMFKRLCVLEAAVANLAERLETIIPINETGLTIDQDMVTIKKMAAAHYRVSLHALDKSTSWRDAVWARQVSMVLCSELLKQNKSRIATVFGRDRNSVAHAFRQVSNIRETEPDAEKSFTRLRVDAIKALKLEAK